MLLFVSDANRPQLAIVDMQDYEKAQTTIRLMNELAKGRLSGESEGWLSPNEMRAHFGAKAHEE